MSTGSLDHARHLIETTARPLPAAPAAPEPPFEVENLGCGAQPGSEQRLRRQQRAWWQGGAIDLPRPSTPQPFPTPPATFQKSIKKTRRRTGNKQLTGKYAPGTSDKDGTSI